MSSLWLAGNPGVWRTQREMTKGGRRFGWEAVFKERKKSQFPVEKNIGCVEASGLTITWVLQTALHLHW